MGSNTTLQTRTGEPFMSSRPDFQNAACRSDATIEQAAGRGTRRQCSTLSESHGSSRSGPAAVARRPS